MVADSTNPFATHPKQFSEFIFGVSFIFIPVIWVLLYCSPDFQEALMKPEILQTLILAQTTLLAIIISITILGVQTTSNLFTGRIQTEFFRTGPFLLAVSIFAIFTLISAVTLIFQDVNPSWGPYLFITSFWFWLWSFISTLAYLTFVPSLIVPSTLIERYVKQRVGEPDRLITEHIEPSNKEKSLSEFTDLTIDAIQLGENDAAESSLHGIYNIADLKMRSYNYERQTSEDQIPTRELVDQALSRHIPRIINTARESDNNQIIRWTIEIYVAIYARSLTLEDGRLAATVESGILNGVHAAADQRHRNLNWEFLDIPGETSKKILQQEFEPNLNLLEMMFGLQSKLMEEYSISDDSTDLIHAGISSLSGGHEAYKLFCEFYEENNTDMTFETPTKRVSDETPPTLRTVASDRHKRCLNNYAQLLSNIHQIWGRKIDKWESEPQTEMVPSILESSLTEAQDLNQSQAIAFSQFYIEAMYLFSDQIKPEVWLSELKQWTTQYGDRDIILVALDKYSTPIQQTYWPLEPENHEIPFEIWIDAIRPEFET
ncbi:hypothetical protein [Halorubrum aidingense]|uniref:hypothetical protein n=1 Tax=Halorubrum aidingense TaxID=368623 RepID=UPI000A707265|nr:hypothetical protein [Halorubrum aidingense]